MTLQPGDAVTACSYFAKGMSPLSLTDSKSTDRYCPRPSVTISNSLFLLSHMVAYTMARRGNVVVGYVGVEVEEGREGTMMDMRVYGSMAELRMMGKGPDAGAGVVDVVVADISAAVGMGAVPCQI